MNVLRGLLFDNLGLKLAALLMALLVYLHVYTDRPATMLVSFPLAIEGLADSLSLAGPLPGAVQAELRGTGKQLIRLRLMEPRLQLSLTGVAAGHFERAVSADDLPITDLDAVKVERLIGPRVITMEIERKGERRLRVGVRVEGAPVAGVHWTGEISIDPQTVLVRGPRGELAKLDSLAFGPIRIEGRRDTVRMQVTPEALPDWCTVDPATVRVVVPLVHER